MFFQRITLFLALSGMAMGFLEDLIQHVRTASQPEKKQFLQGLPRSHELSKGLVEVPTGLEVSKIGFLPMENYTDKLSDGVSREMDCSGGRKTFLALDPKNKRMSNLTCQVSQVLSKDCQTCVSGTPPVLKPPFSIILYDDMICQFETEATAQMKQPTTSFCSVAGNSLRECKGIVENTVEKISWILLREKVVYLEGHSLSWREGPWLSLFDCKNASDGKTQCDLSECKAGRCTGDAPFCSQFACEQSNPVCRCSRNLIPGILHVTIGDNTVIPQCFGHSKWVVQRSRRHVLASSPRSCVDCSVECGVDHVTVVVRHFSPGYYQMCLGPICYTGMAKGKEFKIDIHPMSRISTEEIDMKIWSENKADRFDLQTSCHHMSACDLINCFFCSANWVNIHCFGKEKWVLISLVFSLVCIIVGMALKAVQRIVMFCIWVLKPIIWVCTVCCKYTSKRTFQKMLRMREVMREIDEESGIDLPLLVPIAETPSLPAVSSRENRLARKAKVMMLVSMLSILTRAEACSDSIKLISPAKDCQQIAPNKYSCTFTTTALIPVAPIGQVSCVLLTSQTGESLGIMKIKTLEARLSCLKSDLYWIPKATHQCLGARRCRLVGECINDACMKMSENDYSSEWGARDQIMSRLGWSSCNPQCGGIGCGCFNVNPSCFYLRKTFLNAESLIYKAFECPSWTHSIKVEIFFNRSSQEVLLLPDSPQKTPWGRVQLSSVSAAPNLGFSDCFFESQTGEMFHAPCNRRGEVSTGKLGEIQCPTASDAMQISTNCFSDQSLIHHLINKDVVHCSSQLLDPKEVLKRNKLPSTVGNVIFYPSSGSVYASSSTKISATILLRLNEVQMESVTDRNKCSVRFVNLTGCYNCEAGAILKIETVTDFGTADAVISCPEIGLLTYIISTSVLSTVDTIVHLNKSKISTTCSASCPNSIENFKIDGELTYLRDVDFRHHNETTTPIIQKGKGGIDWFGWLHFTWFQWIWTILFVGFIVVSTVVGFLILKFFLIKTKRT
ncbi:glycoprotein precursor [Khasan virus]|nr:glycoprotein precursor [Khasan virus]